MSGAMRLNIDDMTAMRITIGHGPVGWIIDASALGNGSTATGSNPDHIAMIVHEMVERYMERVRALITDDTKEPTP